MDIKPEWMQQLIAICGNEFVFTQLAVEFKQVLNVVSRLRSGGFGL